MAVGEPAQRAPTMIASYMMFTSGENFELSGPLDHSPASVSLTPHKALAVDRGRLLDGEDWRRLELEPGRPWRERTCHRRGVRRLADGCTAVAGCVAIEALEHGGTGLPF